MDDIKAKQQIVEKIKSSTNILVTVSNNPSVDALSAALGLTLLFDKLEKHPTAVFSGEVPPAISFLEPEKTFDSTTDSLRDFIIALDKEKADHLRYKVEGDSVRIFITPYKTTISSDDLTFSQGDFNVELVIALGVDLQEHLDGALESHGQILHDAAIITVTAGQQVSNLGGIDWHDDQASSLSEMIAGLAEALKTDKTKSLLDAEISTAFLTGIVAETDRFSNTHTTSRVMTVAAQLMAAGADQQLIASKLQESHQIGNSEVPKPIVEPKEVVSEHADSLSITHKQGETLEQLDKRVKQAEQAEAAEVAQESLGDTLGDIAADHTANATAAGVYAIVDEPATTDTVPPAPAISSAYSSEPTAEPTLGGTLNATTEQAADAARTEADSDQNKTILTHSYLDPSAGVSPSSASGAGSSYVLGHDQPVTTEEPPVAAAAPTPTDLGLPMPPAVPDFSAPPAMAPAYALESAPAAQPELLGDILAPDPAAAPIAPISPVVAPIAPPSNDAGQFKIPGQ
jgi:nanoRNase/pAp phosphatase (c-di-AMP/oligoRNAs hydrolase)